MAAAAHVIAESAPVLTVQCAEGIPANWTLFTQLLARRPEICSLPKTAIAVSIWCEPREAR